MAQVVPLGEDDERRPIFCWVNAEQDRILVTFDDTLMLRRKLENSSKIFGLSPAQLALCERLATGHDQAGAALDLGVSVNTVRTQVRRMFEKTGSHSQTELVSLLLSMENADNSVF